MNTAFKHKTEFLNKNNPAFYLDQNHEYHFSTHTGKNPGPPLVRATPTFQIH